MVCMVFPKPICEQHAIELLAVHLHVLSEPMA